MVFKKYISKHILLRLCLLIALIGTAALFDMYNANNLKLANRLMKVPTKKDLDSGKICFYNQVNTYNLKIQSGESFVRSRFACTQNKFLLKHYNLRTFQLMKAESLHSFLPVVCSFNSLPFNRILYSSPDDIPPIS